MSHLYKFYYNLKQLRLIETIFIIVLFVDMFCLVVFGKAYSKYQVFSYIHLHDLILISIFLFSALAKRDFKLPLFEVFIAICLIYLVASVVLNNTTTNENLYYTIRQFMLFGYAIITYFIVSHIFSIKKGCFFAFSLIKALAVLCIVAQFSHITIKKLILLENPIGRNALSPIIMMGLILFFSYSLTLKNKRHRHIIVLFVFFLSLTTGQDSSYISLIAILIVKFFIENKSKRTYIFLASFFLIILLFTYVPSLSDVNATWRLKLWTSTIKKMWYNNSLIFGEGFGVSYMSEETRLELNSIMKDYGEFTIISKERSYKIALHNSFLTMYFHMGLFVLSIPYLFFITAKKQKAKIIEAQKNKALFYAIIGLVVWSSFNLILELPHTSFHFWFMFFAFLFVIKKQPIRQ